MLLTTDGMSYNHALQRYSCSNLSICSLCRDLVNPVQVAIQGFDNAAKRVRHYNVNAYT